MWEIIPLIAQYEHIRGKRISYTYLHGELERECGFDIYSLINCDLPLYSETDYYVDHKNIKDGKYPCQYQGKACTLYFWHCSINRPHGLVVYNDDKESCDYAEMCLKEKLITI